MERLLHEVRHALRRLRKTPGFTITTILTLALGIGATTSIFTLVHAVLLRSLAVTEPDRLIRLGGETHCCVYGGYRQDNEFSIVSFDLYKHFRDNTQGFEELAAFQAGTSLLGVRRSGGKDAAQSFPGEFVSGNYFTMFGVNAYAGRTLSETDDRPQAQPVAVMSFRLWQQKYGSNRNLIGSVFNLNGVPFTVVGIAPPAFFGDTMRSAPPDFFLPLTTEPAVQGESSLLYQHGFHWLDMIGRTKPGANVHAMQAQMRVELKQWLLSHWGEMDDNTRANLPRQTLYLNAGGAGITSMREQYEQWLHILMMVSGFVLAIVCANVANLMLVRGMERRQQTSLNIALGASPSYIVRQALTESILLSLCGGAMGLLLAVSGTQIIVHFAFESIAGQGSVPIDPSLSLPVMAFAFAVSMLTGITFGSAPAWMASRVDPIEALRGANRSTKRSGSVSRKVLVVFQAALSLVLLSLSGLLTTALARLEHQDFGFEQSHRMVVNVDPSLGGYRADQLPTLYRRLHDSIAAIPGVASTAVSSYSPMSGDSWNSGVFVSGHAAPGPRDDNESAFVRASAGFLDVIGAKILQGRDISIADNNQARHVAIVNEAFVKRFFKGEDPMGKHFGRSEIGASNHYEIVGVVKDIRYMTGNLEKPIGPMIFLPEGQIDVFPTKMFTDTDLRTHYLHDIVVAISPGANVSDRQLRAAVTAVDPNLPVVLTQTMNEQVASKFDQQRLIARLTSFFGILSLVLASIGIYGVTAFNASRRVNEIGVRVALGANRANVISLVLRGALGLIALGLMIGVVLSLSAGNLLGSQLYGVSSYNPFVISAAVIALGLSALLASFIPAFRASLVSPIEALRIE